MIKFLCPVLFKENLKLFPNKLMNIFDRINYPDNLNKLLYHTFMIYKLILKC